MRWFTQKHVIGLIVGVIAYYLFANNRKAGG